MASSLTNHSYLGAIFFASFPFVFINFGLPLQADELGISAVGIGGMYTVFTGTMLLIRPLVGYCLDRFGRRWFFTGSFLFYTLAMAVLAQSVDIYDFYLARFLQGIGASLMWVSARTIVADLHLAESRGEAMGRLTSTSVQGSMIGATYGFTLMGIMPSTTGWVWAFAGYAVFAAIGLCWALLRVNETQVQQVSLKLPKLIWTPDLRRILLIVFLSALASALIEPIYLLFLKNKFDLPFHFLALAFLPAGLVFAFVPRYAGRWSDRVGRANVIAIGITFAAVTSIALPLWPSIFLVAGSYILFSVGWAMAGPAEDALVADMAPEQLRGSVLGAREFAAGMGAALGPMLGGYIYENWSQTLAFVINGGVLSTAALLVLFWFRQPHKRQPSLGS